MGLEHLFAGLVQGVGETKLSLEKEKRSREDKDKSEQLQLMTQLLSLPGVKPEMRSQIFTEALKVASGGDKKIVDGMSGLLGPILAQKGDEQTGGVRSSPTGGGGSASAPAPQPKGEAQSATAGLPKFGGQAGGSLGSSGSGGQGRPSMFYSPEEETQQAASRAGAVAQATSDVQVDAELHVAREKLKMEEEKEKRTGWKLTGFTAPNKASGLSSAIYENSATQQIKIGSEQVPHILTAEGLNSIGVNEAVREQGRQEAIKNLAVVDAKDPANITPAEMAAAEKKYASILQTNTTLEQKKTGSEIFKNFATGIGGLDKSTEREGIEVQRQSLEYNRQYDDYQRVGKDIQSQVDMVEKEKLSASEAYNNAMTIKEYLIQKGVREGQDTPDPDDLKQGYTWPMYKQLMGEAEAALGRARNAAQGATGRFKGGVEAGGLERGQWPYLKDNRPGFSYMPLSSTLPEMPTMSGSKSSSKTRRTTGIDVPESLLKELGLAP